MTGFFIIIITLPHDASEHLSQFLEGGRCYSRSLDKAGDNPHITMQHMTVS